MALAQESITRQKILFARKSAANANRPDIKAKRKAHVSHDLVPNKDDRTAAETSIDRLGIDYNLKDGSKVKLEGRHVLKNKDGEIIGVTPEGAEKLVIANKKKKSVAFKRGEQKKKQPTAKKGVLFIRANKKAVDQLLQKTANNTPMARKRNKRSLGM